MGIKSKAWIFVLSWLGWGACAFADTDEALARHLAFGCSYSSHKTFEWEEVSIARNMGAAGATAATTVIRKGHDEEVRYLVKPGEAAECVFPSGHRVRVKVGQDVARPYGMCGGDPEVFASIWVDQRKVASRVWFAGHCRAENGQPEVTFKSSRGSVARLEKCHARLDTSPNTNKIEPVCVDFPDAANFPLDQTEYPPAGRARPVVGDIEILKGTHAVCLAAKVAWKFDSHLFTHYLMRAPGDLAFPSWQAAPNERLPKALYGSDESVYDFDNDGKPDRVLSRAFENGYMDGSVLLVLAADMPPAQAADRGWFLPCHLSATQHPVNACEPFPNAVDARFTLPGRGPKDKIGFTGRYARLVPFTFEGVSYIGVSSAEGDLLHYRAVLKPKPSRTVEPVCLLRQVQDNF